MLVFGSLNHLKQTYVRIRTFTLVKMRCGWQEDLVDDYRDGERLIIDCVIFQ